MTRIRAVLFDLGDTLWHFPRFPPPEVYLARMAAGIESRLTGWGLCDGVDCAALAREIRDVTWRGSADGSDLRSPHFPTLVREVAERLGIRLDDRRAVELWYASNPGGPDLGRELFPDSIPTLEWLKERGYRLGTVTNRALGGEPFMEELRQCGMDRLFESFAISCDDGWRKPAPQLFQKVLDELGVQPEEAVMVGDSLRDDVAGSKALGMVAVWKRPPNPATQQALLTDGTPAEPDFVVDHPGELKFLPPFAVHY
jgi:FMN phosphatase YigB (HAD superfamily)